MPPPARGRAPAALLRRAVAALLVACAASDCAFTQTCTTGTPGCHPVPSPHPPVPAPGPFPLACPQYASSSCCTAEQVRAARRARAHPPHCRALADR